MNKQELVHNILEKRSFLCVGLDTDIEKLPSHLPKNIEGAFEFNKAIIDATLPYCVAYKPNIAFYESQGSMGMDLLEKTLSYIPKEVLSIADAKRGDIGNTAKMYAKTYFETYKFDAVTVSPYMGIDTIKPFLDYKNNWTIVLALTSNKGSDDFEQLNIGTRKLYEEVLLKTSKIGTDNNLMFVVGATKAEYLTDIRKIVPNHFLLVPGVGAQGGNLKDVAKFGFNKDIGLLVNSSRGIIYASSDKNFAKAAENNAKEIQLEMQSLIQTYF